LGKRVVHAPEAQVPPDGEKLARGELSDLDAVEADHALSRASVVALTELRTAKQESAKRAAATGLIEIDMDLGNCISEVSQYQFEQGGICNQKLAIARAMRRFGTYQVIEQTETHYLSPSYHNTVLARLAEAECIGELQYTLCSAKAARQLLVEVLPAFARTEPVALL